MFNDWAKKIHEQNLITEIEQIDQQSILKDQSSLEDVENRSNLIIHNIEELEKDRKKKSLSSRVLSVDGLDLDADPRVPRKD